MSDIHRRSIVLIACMLGAGSWAGVVPPSNEPAEVSWKTETGELRVRYHGRTILDGELGAGVRMTSEVKPGEKVEQRLTFSSKETGRELAIRVTVSGSVEAFAAETESEAQKRFPLVRNSVGPSRNLRNNAVYDHRWDWVLAGPGDGATRIVAKTDAEDSRTFELTSRGASIQLVFRPRFYQKHLGYEAYEPWTYPVWEGSLTGYCTWWAYRKSFVQETLDAMLKLFVEKRLPDFGYDYMQFDDTYQQGNGSCPENWLNWNKNFPGGWEYSVNAIRKAGMKPGIWVHRIHRPTDPHVKDIAAAHPDWFVRREDGSLVQHRGFYMLDTTNEEAVENMVRKLYRALKQQGWDYVKIDGTGDLLSAYRNKACENFFKTHPTTPEQSLRKWDEVAREELGRDVYILACHTVANAQNVIGLVDGARLSNDGFQPTTLAAYNHLEGVVWRNDPDHCDVLGGWLMDNRAEMPVFGMKEPVPARTIVRPAICAMAGGVLMVSDKLEVYQDDRNIEGMKRSAPVLFTRPGQLYSCGRRPMEWWLQEIDRPFDHWNVLARIQWGERQGQGKETDWPYTGLPENEVRFSDLGLESDRDYLVFEFWTQKFLGKHQGSFTAPAMDKRTGMQIFAIRETRDYPWVLSTTRHLSQGGVSLSDVRWNADTKTLSGSSAVVHGDPYVLTVHLPDGHKLENAEVGGDKAEVTVQKEIATVRSVPSATGDVRWSLRFTL